MPIGCNRLHLPALVVFLALRYLHLERYLPYIFLRVHILGSAVRLDGMPNQYLTLWTRAKWASERIRTGVRVYARREPVRLKFWALASVFSFQATFSPPLLLLGSYIMKSWYKLEFPLPINRCYSPSLFMVAFAAAAAAANIQSHPMEGCIRHCCRLSKWFNVYLARPSSPEATVCLLASLVVCVYLCSHCIISTLWIALFRNCLKAIGVVSTRIRE